MFVGDYFHQQIIPIWCSSESFDSSRIETENCQNLLERTVVSSYATKNIGNNMFVISPNQISVAGKDDMD